MGDGGEHIKGRYWITDKGRVALTRAFWRQATEEARRMTEAESKIRG